MVANVVDEMSFADKALGSQMVADKPPKYIDASIIPPTSVMVESLFSESDYAFDDRRLGTSPEHIEQVMFLKKNHFLWDLEFFCREVLNGVNLDIDID